MTLEYKGNVAPENATDEQRGLWNVFEDAATGKSSYTEHVLKTVWTSCEPGECYFEISNSAKREATCTKCGLIKHFIVGLDILKDGKFSHHPQA